MWLSIMLCSLYYSVFHIEFQEENKCQRPLTGLCILNIVKGSGA